jgi:CDP-diacylglycerol pyrophosphatase
VVDPAQGYALLKDRNGVAQFLLIATLPIAGLEDPAFRDGSTPDYFAIAWANLAWVQRRLAVPVAADRLALAVNAAERRSQDRFHIHMDCMRPDVWRALRQHEAEVHSRWTTFPVALAGEHWRAVRVASLAHPFPAAQLSRLDDAGADLLSESIVIVSSSVDGEYLLLETHFASGESLQDHTCAIMSADPDPGFMR